MTDKKITVESISELITADVLLDEGYDENEKALWVTLNISGAALYWIEYISNKNRDEISVLTFNTLEEAIEVYNSL